MAAAQSQSNQPPESPQEKLPIVIRSMEGRNYKIAAKADWTVLRLKEELEKWLENGASCVLIYRAKRLEDGKTLGSYNIAPDSIVQANVRSSGGDGLQQASHTMIEP